MWILKGIFVALAVCCIEAKSMGLEDFMSALSSKTEDDSQEEAQESGSVSDHQLLQFAKRSGLAPNPQPSDGQVSLATALQALQALKRQQSLQVYSPDYVQPLATPQRSPRAVSNSLPAYEPDYQKPQQSQKSPNAYASSSSSDYQTPQKSPNPQTSSYSYSTSQQSPQNSQTYDGKSVVKDDRQGQYGYDGYEPAVSHSRTPVDHYHQPADHYHHSKVALPVPSVSIKFDPLGLLKLLLQGIPRPLFNLNGKIFLGLELGKNVGLAKGGHAAPHGGHYGNERVINIG